MDYPSFTAFHRELDARIIGYAAYSTNYAQFDGAILVCATKSALDSVLLSLGITGFGAIESIAYQSLVSSMDEDGITFHLDAPADAILRQTVSEDLRYVRGLFWWETSLGVLIEPEYNPFSDPIAVLKAQVDTAILGYSAYDGGRGVITDDLGRNIIAGTEAFCRDRVGVGPCYDEIAPISFRDFLRQVGNGVRFSTDPIVESRMGTLLRDDAFCRSTYENGLQ